MTDTHDGLAWTDFEAALRGAISAALDEPVAELAPATHLLDDVGLDSYGVLVVVHELETRFGVTLPPFDAEPTAGLVFQLVAGAGGCVVAAAGD